MMRSSRLRQNVPQHTLDALERYVEHHLRPGGFLMAVLMNQFIDAIFLADKENRLALKEIATYVYWELPRQCWGSREIVENWLSQKGGIE